MFNGNSSHAPEGRGRMTTRMLVSLALLSAIGVVLKLIVPMFGATSRYSIEAVPVILAGLLFGPIPGALVGFVYDFVGAMFTGYGFNPVFSVPPILIGLCAGLLRFLVIRKPGFISILLSFLPAIALGSVLWQGYWLSVLYGRNTYAFYLGTRSIQFAIVAPLDAAIILGLFKSRMFEALRLWPPSDKGR